jgi:hypothetical protein
MQPTRTTAPDISTTGNAQEASIRHLLAHGKSKTALDRAKELHKAVGSAASEALLIDAYAGRIQALLEQNLTLEAKSLLDLVRARHPSASSRLDALSASSSARAGALDELLGPLADADLPAERRAAIEQAVQTQITDLAALADCAALPAGHALRVAAAAIDRAFGVVTSGPVTDEQIALPEVSHRSPLAPWKLLVRAIAHFYRGEDDACRECLGLVKPESMPARLVPAMRSMLGARPAGPLSPAEAALVSRTVESAAKLRNELEKLDRAFVEEASEDYIYKLVRAAMQECRVRAPEKAETLKRLIWAQGAMDAMDEDHMAAALQGMPRQDATFFRTLAHRMEITSEGEDLALACEYWDEFRQHAVREGWFAAKGMEVATLYAHMAAVLRRIPDDMLEEFQDECRQRRSLENSYFLYPERLYERACLLDPHPETFSQWLKWTQEGQRDGEDVAKVWHRMRPMDIDPILYLMQEAEERDAYPSALTYLDKAESIDAVHSVVRAARLRLLAGGALRHLQQKKPHLAAEKLKAIAELPQSRQGDRPAFVAALGYVIGHNRNDFAAMAEARAGSARLLGSDIAGGMLALGIAAAAKCRNIDLPRAKHLGPEDRSALPAAIARVVSIATDMGIANFKMPLEYVDEAARQFAQASSSLDTGQLRSLAETARAAGNVQFSYSVSGEGLRRGGSTQARFLLLRARSLPEGLKERLAVCAAAAAELARAHRDHDIVSEAVDMVRSVYGAESFSLTSDQAASVVQKEIAAADYPEGGRGGPDYSDLLPDELCDCPDCRRARGESAFSFDGDFLDEEDFENGSPDEKKLDKFFAQGIPPGMPSELRQVMLEVMKEGFRRGETPEETMARVMSDDEDPMFGPPLKRPPKKKKGKRK